MVLGVSWGGLGAYVGGPGRPWGEMWPKPEREDRNVAQAQAGTGPKGARPEAELALLALLDNM